MRGLQVLVVTSAEHVNKKDIGKAIGDCLDQGSDFHVALVPDYPKDYDFWFWPNATASKILADARKKEIEMPNTRITTTEEKT